MRPTLSNRVCKATTQSRWITFTNSLTHSNISRLRGKGILGQGWMQTKTYLYNQAKNWLILMNWIIGLADKIMRMTTIKTVRWSLKELANFRYKSSRRERMLEAALGLMKRDLSCLMTCRRLQASIKGPTCLPAFQNIKSAIWMEWSRKTCKEHLPTVVMRSTGTPKFMAQLKLQSILNANPFT